MIKFTSLLLCLFPYLTFAATTLTIDQVEGEGGSITVYYTVVDVSGDLFETVNWQYSLDDGETWLDIDSSGIGNNDR
ncbi:hypothetical protein IH992_33200, partial [Candidatus Poribacteria bacterium]|nr:hypothetical protein [Candidatus Poribacteria bacterium]